MKEFYMNEAINLAKLGEGFVNPNPLVGAVIVKDDKIIGKGYHKIYGGNHAEIEALNSCKEDVKNAHMYVTLEPCSHYGKTPPCAKAIVEAGIKKVTVAMLDPNPMVSGNGIKILRKNNIDVEIGILEEKARKLNEIFIKYIKDKTPFCMVKAAISLDGKIATYKGDSKWITQKESREYVHVLRNKFSSIMVGVNTILQDNPHLTTRLKNKDGRNPIRIVVDSKGRIPLNSNIFKKKGENIIAVTDKIEKDTLRRIENVASKVIVTPDNNGKVDLKYLMKALGKLNIDSVFIEGGGTLNYSAFNLGIVDKVLCFIAPKIIGGKDAKTFVEGQGVREINQCILLEDMDFKKFRHDILVEAYVKKC